MSIHLIAVGENISKWVAEGIDEYLRRIPANYGVIMTDIRPAKRLGNYNAEKCLLEESDAILKAIPSHSYVVALDVLGKSMNTPQLATQLEQWRMQYRHICFLIGGPDGLAEPCLAKSQLRWSLSALTFPHALVRVLWAEQMYRAWSLSNGHPYHR